MTQSCQISVGVLKSYNLKSELDIDPRSCCPLWLQQDWFPFPSRASVRLYTPKCMMSPTRYGCCALQTKFHRDESYDVWRNMGWPSASRPRRAEIPFAKSEVCYERNPTYPTWDDCCACVPLSQPFLNASPSALAWTAACYASVEYI